MHYHWKTGQPCNCGFHKPVANEAQWITPEYTPRGDDSREIVGQRRDNTDESDN
jgi:hypothetical protein